MREPKRYTYGPIRYIQLGLLLLCTAFIVLVAIRGRFQPGDWIYPAMFGPVFAFAAYLTLVVWLDVDITAEGLRKPFYGLRGRFVAWDELTSVRFVRSKSGRWMYVFFTPEHSFLGAFRFTSDIRDSADLVERVNAELLKRGVPIRTWKGNTLVPAAALPTPGSGRVTPP